MQDVDDFEDRVHYYLEGPSSDGEGEPSSTEMDFTEEQIWDAMDGSGGGSGGGGGEETETAHHLDQRGFLMNRSPSLSRVGSNNGRRPWVSSIRGGDGGSEYSRGGSGGVGAAQSMLRSLMKSTPRARGGGDAVDESESDEEDFVKSGSSGVGGGVMGMRQQAPSSGSENGTGVPGIPIDIIRSGQQRSTLLPGGGQREQMPRFGQSAPVAVPRWSNSSSGCYLYPENHIEEWERHVSVQEYFDLIRAPDRRQQAFSNLEGRGRTLRGRDALLMRDTVWKNIGYDA